MKDSAVVEKVVVVAPETKEEELNMSSTTTPAGAAPLDNNNNNVIVNIAAAAAAGEAVAPSDNITTTVNTAAVEEEIDYFRGKTIWVFWALCAGFVGYTVFFSIAAMLIMSNEWVVRMLIITIVSSLFFIPLEWLFIHKAWGYVKSYLQVGKPAAAAAIAVAAITLDSRTFKLDKQILGCVTNLIACTCSFMWILLIMVWVLFEASGAKSHDEKKLGKLFVYNLVLQVVTSLHFYLIGALFYRSFADFDKKVLKYSRLINNNDDDDNSQIGSEDDVPITD